MRAYIQSANHWLRSPRVRRALQIGFVALVLVFFGRALYDLTPQIAAYRWEFDPVYLSLAVLMLGATGPAGTYGWWAIMRKLGHSIRWWRALKILYYSALAGLLPGSMWYAVSRVYLAEREGVPRLVTALSLILETVLLVLGAAIVASLSLLAWPDPPPVVLWAGGALLAVLVGLLLQPNALFRVLNRLLVRLGRSPINVRFTAGDMLYLLWPFVLNRLVFGLMSFLLVAALYPHLPVWYLPVVVGLFTAAWLGGYLAVFVPQGLVVRELLITGLLTALLGIPAPVAAAAAVLSRLWSLAGIGLWGLIATRL